MSGARFNRSTKSSTTRMLNLMEIVFYETKLFYKIAIRRGTLASYNFILPLGDRFRLAGCIFLE